MKLVSPRSMGVLALALGVQGMVLVHPALAADERERTRPVSPPAEKSVRTGDVPVELLKVLLGGRGQPRGAVTLIAPLGEVALDGTALTFAWKIAGAPGGRSGSGVGIPTTLRIFKMNTGERPEEAIARNPPIYEAKVLDGAVHVIKDATGLPVGVPLAWNVIPLDDAKGTAAPAGTFTLRER